MMSVVFVVLAGAVTPVAAQDTAVEPTTTTGPTESPVWNNSTAAHENPDEISERGDLGRVGNWLSDRMRGQFAQSGIELSQSEYELAREYVGEEYDGYLDQYVDVAGETDSESDNTAAEAFETAEESQTDLIDRAEEFEEAESAYEEARESGSVSEARRQARRMANLSSQVSQDRDEIVGANSRLEDTLNIPDPLGTDPINETAERIENTSQTALYATFENTTVKVVSADPVTSPVDSLEIAGQIGNESGVLLTNQTVTVEVGGESSEVQINESGVFEVWYTPVDREPGKQEINVSYVPDPETPYLGSDTAVNVTVQSVNASITLSSSASNGSFGDSISVTGRVSASNTSIEGVTVSGSLGVEGFSGETNATGQFHSTVPVPQDIAAGEASIAVGVDAAEPLVQSDTVRTSVQIRPLTTTLSMGEGRTDSTQLVRGELLTERGDPVPGQSVVLEFGDAETRTVQTNASGWYTAQIPAAYADSNETIGVTASYQSGDSHLQASNASMAVALIGGDGGDVGSGDGGDVGSGDGGAGVLDSFIEDWVSMSSLGIVLVLLGISGVYVYLRRSGSLDQAFRSGTASDSPDPPDITPTLTPSSQAEEAAQGVDIEGAANKRDAIHQSYASLRERLAERFAVANADTLTLQEFRQEVAPQLQTGGALGTVSEIYDRVIYGGETPDSETIETYSQAQDRLRDEVQDTAAADGGQT